MTETIAPVKMDRFSGLHPDRWLLQADRYFDFCQVRDEEYRVIISSLYFDGDAAYWYDWMYRDHKSAGWDHFKRALLSRFRPKDFDKMEGLQRDLLAIQQDYRNMSASCREITLLLRQCLDLLPPARPESSSEAMEELTQVSGIEAEHVLDVMPMPISDATRLFGDNNVGPVMLDQMPEQIEIVTTETSPGVAGMISSEISNLILENKDGLEETAVARSGTVGHLVEDQVFDQMSKRRDVVTTEELNQDSAIEADHMFDEIPKPFGDSAELEFISYEDKVTDSPNFDKLEVFDQVPDRVETITTTSLVGAYGLVAAELNKPGCELGADEVFNQMPGRSNDKLSLGILFNEVHSYFYFTDLSVNEHVEYPIDLAQLREETRALPLNVGGFYTFMGEIWHQWCHKMEAFQHNMRFSLNCDLVQVKLFDPGILTHFFGAASDMCSPNFNSEIGNRLLTITPDVDEGNLLQTGFIQGYSWVIRMTGVRHTESVLTLNMNHVSSVCWNADGLGYGYSNGAPSILIFLSMLGALLLESSCCGSIINENMPFDPGISEPMVAITVLKHEYAAILYSLLISSAGILFPLIAVPFDTDSFEIQADKEIEPALKKQFLISMVLTTVGSTVTNWVGLIVVCVLVYYTSNAHNPPLISKPVNRASLTFLFATFSDLQP